MYYYYIAPFPCWSNAKLNSSCIHKNGLKRDFDDFFGVKYL